MTALDRMTARLSLGVATVVVLVIANLPAYSAPSIIQGYYEELKSKQCTQALYCVMPFSAVPAGKLLTVRHISCRITTAGSSAPPLTALYLTLSSRYHFLIPSLIHGAGTPKRTFYAGGEMLRLAEEGTAPQVSVVFGSTLININLNCTLTGQITP